MSARATFLQRMATRGGWFRQTFFWLHLGAGIVASLVIFILAGTGMVLAFEDEVVGWAERGVTHVAPPAEGQQRLSLDELAAKALLVPKAERVTNFTLQRDPEAAVRFQLGRDRTVLLNPYTGEILGEGADKLHAWFHKVVDLHRYFLMEGKSRDAAKQVKNIANATFLLLILSGLYLWWPKSWTLNSLKAVSVPTMKLRGKARDFNWHNSLGLLFWPAIFTISLTGLIMSYGWASDLLYKATGNEPPPRPVPPAATAAPAEKPVGMPGREQAAASERRPKRAGQEGTGERRGQREPGGRRRENRGTEEGRPERQPEAPRFEVFFKAAEAQVPDWKSISYRAPRPGQDNASLSIITEDAPPPRGRGTLSVDAKTAEVKKWEPYSEQNMGRKLRLWARWTHTGQSLGLLGQCVALLACMAILLLVYTGLALSWRRFFR